MPFTYHHEHKHTYNVDEIQKTTMIFKLFHKYIIFKCVLFLHHILYNSFKLLNNFSNTKQIVLNT